MFLALNMFKINFFLIDNLKVTDWPLNDTKHTKLPFSF